MGDKKRWQREDPHAAILASSELSTFKSKGTINATILESFTKSDGALAEALKENWSLRDVYGEMSVNLNEWVCMHVSACHAVCLGSYHEYDRDDDHVGWNCFGVLLRKIQKQYLVKAGVFFVHHTGELRKGDMPSSTEVDWIVV